MTLQVVLTEEIRAAAGRRLLEEVARVDVAAALDEENLATALRSAGAVVLRVIGRYGAGVNNIDVAAAEEPGIRVVRAAGANSQAVPGSDANRRHP